MIIIRNLQLNHFRILWSHIVLGLAADYEGGEGCDATAVSINKELARAILLQLLLQRNF